MRIFRIILMACMLLSPMAAPLCAKEKKYKNGSVYNGEMKSGKPNGKGMMTYPNGIVYDGTWLKGYPLGEGIISTKDGKKFEGKFTPKVVNEVITDFRRDEGTYTVPGVVMEGKWEYSGMFEGTVKAQNFNYTGTLDYLPVSNDGIIYVDKKKGFVNGKIDGILAKSYLLDVPAHYKGEIRARNFTGKLYGDNLSPEIESFEADVDLDQNTNWTVTTKNGGEYRGEMFNKKFSGEGKLTSNNLELSGEWQNGILKDGSGVETFRDDTGIKEYNYYVVGGHAYYVMEDDTHIKLDTPPSGVSLYDDAKRKVVEFRLAQEKAERERIEKEEQARLEKELIEKEYKDAANLINKKYLGMKFVGRGGFLGAGEQTGIANLLFGSSFNVEFTVSFMPGGKIVVYKNFKSNSNDPMIMAMSVELGENAVKNYKARLKGDYFVLNDSGLCIKMASDGKSLRIFDQHSGYTLKRK